jgi:hypothetical protein
MELYHITRPINIPSILIHGLLPAEEVFLKLDIMIRGKGITLAELPLWSHVFLTNNPMKVIECQLGVHEYLCNKWAVLRVDCTDLDPQPLHIRDGATYALCDFQYTLKHVPVKNIII